MYVEITEAADFYRQVSPAYHRLRAASGAGDTLEIVLGGGTYEGVNLSLGDGLDARPIDLIVRAADRTRPPVLRDLACNLTARTLHLDGLIFAHGRKAVPIVRLAVSSELHVERCALVDAASLASADGHLVELLAIGGQGAATATISDSWFVRNWAQDGGAMVACVTVPPHFFAQIEFRNVAFLDNHADVSIAPGATTLVQLSDSVVCESTEPDATAPKSVYLALDVAHTRLRATGSVLIAEDLEHLLGRDAVGHEPANGVPLVDFGDSQVVLRHPPTFADHPLPFTVQADRLAAVADACMADVEGGALPQRDRLAATLLAT